VASRSAGARRPAGLFLQKPALRASGRAYSKSLAAGFKRVKPGQPGLWEHWVQ